MTDQATEQSGEAQQESAGLTVDSLAALFDGPSQGKQPQGQAAPQEEEEAGDEPEVEGEQDAEAQTSEKFKVPALEGEGFEELTADEIKARMLMQSDYTKKTQALAEQRKAIEAEVSKRMQSFSEREQAMEAHLANLAGAIQTFDAQVDWEALRKEDPSAFLEAREQQAQRIAAFKQSLQYRDQVQQQQRAEMVAQGTQRLMESMPELLDPNNLKAFGEKVVSGAAHYGFDPAEIANIVDHRHFLVLKDAIAYRELKAKAGEVKQTVAKAPQLAKPGAAKPGNAQALATHRVIKKAQSTGKVDDLAAAFDAYGNGRRK